MTRVFLGYTTISFVFFGLRLLPDPTRELVGFGGDPQIFVWSFAWWPHALGSGENPLQTELVWAPEGLDLSWVTTVPALAVAYAPLTLIGGATLAYNAAAILAPALAATACFLLCRHVTGALWPSLVGGYVFGFSAYMLGHTLGHLNLTAVFLVPLMALFVLRYAESALDRRGLAWRLALVLAAQLWISTELFFTATVMLVGGSLIALLSLPELRPRLLSLVAPLLAAYGFAAVAAAPLLLHVIRNEPSGSINRPEDFGADLLNLVVPTRLIAAGAVWAPPLAERFAGNDAETTAYFGLPTLAAIVWFAATRWDRRGSRFLVFAFVAAAIAALGTSLRVAGSDIVWMPWSLLVQLPLFDHALPVRFSLFASLAAAVMVALVLRSSGRTVSIVLPVLIVLSLLPRLELSLWHQEPVRPAFFVDGLYRDCLRKGENVFTVPYNAAGHSLLWQVDADFEIRLPGGYLRPGLPSAFTQYKALWELHFDGVIPGTPDLTAFFEGMQVDRAVVELSHHESWKATLAHLGPPSIVGGAAVYPRCGTQISTG